MPIGKRLGAEFLGTLVLVMGGCGAAMTAMVVPGSGLGHLGVALTFGLFMTALGFALGNVSGAHFNPAVTLGLFVARRFPGKDVMPYILAQLGGALLGAGTLYVIVSGRAGFSPADGFFANGFGELSPGGFSLRSVMAAEVLLTFFYVMVIAATTDRRALTAVSPIAAGVALTAVYIVGIPLDAGSINPARSIAAAMMEGGRSIMHVWLFIFAPLMGGALAGAVVPLLLRNPSQDAGEA
jgi:aquaporin Z